MTETLEIWREISRHQDLDSLVERVFPIMSASLPLRRITFRRFDHEGKRLWTIASTPRLATVPPARVELSAEQAEALAGWNDDPVLVQSSDVGEPALWQALTLDDQSGDVAAIRLVDEAQHAGHVILELRPGEKFSGRRLASIFALVEPFSVAFQNDRRIEELSRLRQAAEADNRALLSRLERQDLTEVIGAESGLRGVMQRVELVARTDAPVLILGETGSGKEVIARTIHTRSRRAAGPLLRVNCGAIPAELVDAELFGHERGSFTGAVGTRQGWFERADGGTLFLDEIGELTLAAQVRLLRVLQDGTFERVGGQKTLSADVRIIAATHRDLEQMVRAGTFRQDLWFRLGVFPVPLPPLRARREDLPALVNHLAARAGRRLSGVDLHASPADLELLRQYHWPGNVRELAAVIERAAILGDGRRLEVRAALGMSSLDATASAPTSTPQPATAPAATTGLNSGATSAVTSRLAPTGAAFAAPAQSPAFGASPPAPAYQFAEPFGASAFSASFHQDPTSVEPSSGSRRPGVTLEDAMRSHIEGALVRAHGRIEGPYGAAALLSINPHTLRSRMRKLGIRWQAFRPEPFVGAERKRGEGEE